MRYRQLPPAGDLADLESVRRAVPRDPAETDDCCARVCDRTAVDTREQASQWLVFLTALGCVTDEGTGYYRDAADIDHEELAERFVSHVFGVPEVLGVLDGADRPLTRAEIADRLDARTRERFQRTDPGPDYLGRLLAWAVSLDRVAVAEDGYVLRE
jgi:hypothetical protein